ncbi:zinc ribbon domain-containing protein [Burkholderia gladioli]|uniref:zinc ribbon domain-containing protein n=1 Tax=Burkholderia gladioli TaxID=28095 RepID=UPI00163F06F0|nr:zinc ribbon domain-containing protein [Burkholderia gladioli]
MIYVVVWLIVAIVTALIANAKNRSPLAWAILAIPLGLFATIVVACSKKLPLDEKPAVGFPMREDEKQCPQCAESVKYAAKVCRFCGHQFGDSSRQAL